MMGGVRRRRMMGKCCEGDEGRMIVWLGDGWCETATGEDDVEAG